MIYYVNARAERDGNGSKQRPFKHIDDAARIAVAGDEIIVAPGVYREKVTPRNAGREDARIVYRSEKPLGAVITGAGMREVCCGAVLRVSPPMRVVCSKDASSCAGVSGVRDRCVFLLKSSDLGMLFLLAEG